MTGDDHGGDWARYWRADQLSGPVEAMHAHFRSHVYHRHSHETYSFGVTDDGAQAFTCRGGHHVSTANMVMLFNPDDPHDGHAATGPGFTYRMILIAPDLVRELFAGTGPPLFPTPVVNDPELARRLRQLHTALTSSSHPSSTTVPPTPPHPQSTSTSDTPTSTPHPPHPPAPAPPPSSTPPTPLQPRNSLISLQQHEYLRLPRDCSLGTPPAPPWSRRAAPPQP